MSVALSPNGRTIATDMQGSIWTMPAAGGAMTRVTDVFNDARQPAWSPDGTRIAGLTGLREASEKTLGGKSFACPSCGASLELKLSTTLSIACHQCKAVVDVSQGVGADLSHYAQSNAGHDGAEPQIPLGSSGRLALDGRDIEWQVVGYLERCDIPDDADDEQTFWREYLLFNRQEGFIFLVDSEDGWSWAKPLTGAPQVRGDAANWQGRSYRKTYGYSAKVTWVLGEFYWRVRRDERALVTDYVGQGSAAARRLSREQSGQEVTWSEGATLEPAQLARAFGLAATSAVAMQRSTAPSLTIDGGLAKALLIIAVVLVVLMMGFCSSRDRDCADVRATFGEASTEYQQCVRNARTGSGFRTGGGSFGGYSSGGGHK